MDDSLQVHQYFADANEAESWMREKEPIVCNQDYGKDEDSSEALLKKHEALMSDLEAFGNTIQVLKDQAQSCRVFIQIIVIKIVCDSNINHHYLFNSNKKHLSLT